MDAIEKEKKLLELYKEHCKYEQKLRDINNEKMRIQLDGHDYTGKFIKIDEYGYIYVINQVVEDEKIHLIGFYFNGSVEPCAYDFHLETDACHTMSIGLNRFIELIDGDNIHEMSQDEFVSMYETLSTATLKNYKNMLNSYVSLVEEAHNKD